MRELGSSRRRDELSFDLDTQTTIATTTSSTKSYNSITTTKQTIRYNISLRSIHHSKKPTNTHPHPLYPSTVARTLCYCNGIFIFRAPLPLCLHKQADSVYYPSLSLLHHHIQHPNPPIFHSVTSNAAHTISIGVGIRQGGSAGENSSTTPTGFRA